MFSSKTGIAAGATIATVGAFAAVGMGAANPGMAGKTVAQSDVIKTEVQIIRRTIHLRAKPKSRPLTAPVNTGGATYAAANPPSQTAAYRSTPTAATTPAPTVSTHSSGGYSSESEGGSGDDGAPHSEKEGSDD